MANETIKILVGTPMYGGQCHGQYVQSMLQLKDACREKAYDLEFLFLYNESLITRARDSIANFFVRGDFTHLLFIDADVVVNPQDIITMIEEDRDIVCGCYAIKHINWRAVSNYAKMGAPAELLSMYSSEYVFNVEDGQDKELRSAELKEVAHAGTGYMLIKRKVFEKLSERTPTYKGNTDSNHGELVKAYFMTSIDEDTGVLLSEDYHFCKEWRKAGGKIYIAPYAHATHIGTHAFG